MMINLKQIKHGVVLVKLLYWLQTCLLETVAEMDLYILVTLLTFVLLLSLFGGQPSQMQKLCRSGDTMLFVG